MTKKASFDDGNAEMERAIRRAEITLQKIDATAPERAQHARQRIFGYQTPGLSSTPFRGPPASPEEVSDLDCVMYAFEQLRKQVDFPDDITAVVWARAIGRTWMEIKWARERRYGSNPKRGGRSPVRGGLSEPALRKMYREALSVLKCFYP